jgi:hypothetical protein
MLPPGRAKLATIPLPTGSNANAKTIGITDVACFVEHRASRCDNDIDLKSHKLGRDLRVSLSAPFRPAKFDCNITTLDPAEVA